MKELGSNGYKSYKLGNLHLLIDSHMAMVKQYSRAAKDLGLMLSTGLSNSMLRGSPEHIRATPPDDPLRRRWSGYPVCPSNDKSHAYIIANARRLYEVFLDTGLDFTRFWPYNHGGCTCERRIRE